MEFKVHPFEYYVNLIKEEKNFTLSKIGDGELICMFKAIGCG